MAVRRPLDEGTNYKRVEAQGFLDGEEEGESNIFLKNVVDQVIATVFLWSVVT